MPYFKLLYDILEEISQYSAKGNETRRWQGSRPLVRGAVVVHAHRAGRRGTGLLHARIFMTFPLPVSRRHRRELPFAVTIALPAVMVLLAAPLGVL